MTDRYVVEVGIQEVTEAKPADKGNRQTLGTSRVITSADTKDGAIRKAIRLLEVELDLSPEDKMPTQREEAWTGTDRRAQDQHVGKFPDFNRPVRDNPQA